jgi:circadian clock protein KaiC
MKSLGMDLGPGLTNGLLTIRAFRPTFRGLEEHLVSILVATDKTRPSCVVMDPISNFVNVGGVEDVRSMLTRVLDVLKRRGVTLLMTALTNGVVGKPSKTEVQLSSLVDTWIELSLDLKDAAHRRTAHVIKSRGMDHSRETREMTMSAAGLSLVSPNSEAGA